jgi:hypothetical protein
VAAGPEKDVAIQPAQAQQLRQRAGVAERIDVVTYSRAATQQLEQFSLAVESMAGERFARGDVAVGLEPPAVDRHPLAAIHRRPDGGEQRRVVLGHPTIGDGAAAGKDVAR